MASMEKKSLDSPDETLPSAKSNFEIVNLGGMTIGRATVEPGWRWSEDEKPSAGTTSCQIPHLGYVIAGRMRFKMDDGAELEVGPHDVVVVPPGHDAWVAGDEPFVVLDFGGATQYGSRRRRAWMR